MGEKMIVYYLKVKESFPEAFFWNMGMYDRSYCEQFSHEQYMRNMTSKYGWEFSSIKNAKKILNNMPKDYRNYFEIVEQEKVEAQCYKLVNNQGEFLSTTCGRWGGRQSFVSKGGLTFVNRNNAMAFLNKWHSNLELFAVQ
jgi:hypothetical protein